MAELVEDPGPLKKFTSDLMCLGGSEAIRPKSLNSAIRFLVFLFL
jgi:hypothetical protein